MSFLSKFRGRRSVCLSGKRFSSEQALNRRFLSPFSFTQTKEQAVSFQELRLCLRKNIPETFSFPFLVIPSDRYALSRTISTLLDDHVMNQRNKYVFSFVPLYIPNLQIETIPVLSQLLKFILKKNIFN